MPDKEKPKDNIDKARLYRDVYVGKITVYNLPQSVYNFNANKLNHAVKIGFGIAMDTTDEALVEELHTSVFMFSGAKTFQQTLEMSSKLVDADGFTVPFKEFEAEADAIFEKYNVNWLEAEYNTAITSARSAAHWNNIEKTKRLFPYLQYSAVMDEHTCEICRPLDGITLPVNDPFWSSNVAPNHFNCECVIIQLDADSSDDVTDKEVVQERVERSGKEKNPLFNFNPGKDKAIFKDTGKNKHPYFEVSKKYRELAKRNFDLPIKTT